MFRLHSVPLPGSSDKHPELYLRGANGASAGDKESLSLNSGETVATDTYFGVFPWAQWKRLTDVSNVSLVLEGQGALSFAVKALGDNSNTDVIIQRGSLFLNGSQAVDLTPLSTFDTAGLYVELTAEGATILRSIGFATTTPPARTVQLGLVITSFGRAAVVAETIGKLEAFIASDPESEVGAFTLTVVDNGRELDATRFPTATVLPNPNLGGAGGFARGLSHLCDSPAATHGCFMDDDAATEPECLLRMRRLLAYARNDRMAVSGAMLRSETSFMMHEQGAIIEWGRNHRIISRKNGLDLLKRSSLERVLQPETIGYGGWWLFAFPIRGALRFPYPLFVRGDDWLFSYLNSFTIEAMPGICSWQEGFENKISPTEQYLAFKAFLVAEILLREPANARKTLFFFLAWITRNLFGYCYDRAALNCEAFSDVLDGPGFWERHAALGPRLGELRSLVRSERLQPIDPPLAALPLARMPGPERRRRFLLRLVTLNGHLVPTAVARRLAGPTIAVAQIEAPQPVFTFLRSLAVYRMPDGARAFLAERDSMRFFRLLWRTMRLSARLVTGYGTLARSYRNSVDRICTKEWWDETILVEKQR